MKDNMFVDLETGQISDLSIDPECIVEDIDVDAIGDLSIDIAMSMCNNLKSVYFNDEFMEKNPTLKKRLDTEIESLRVLIKMRKSDERIHDILVRSIGANSSNASLYSALSKVQKSLLDIQKQMDETIKAIDGLLKNTQLELNFDVQEDENDEKPTTGVNRGTKDFINNIRNECK